jgi:hypothetical protein
MTAGGPRRPASPTTHASSHVHCEDQRIGRWQAADQQVAEPLGVDLAAGLGGVDVAQPRWWAGSRLSRCGYIVQPAGLAIGPVTCI